MSDPIITQALTTILAALIGAASSIVAAIIDGRKSEKKLGIVLPENVRLPPPKIPLRWVLVGTIAGGIIGFLVGGGLRQAPKDVLPDPTAIAQSTQIVASPTFPVNVVTATDAPLNSPTPLGEINTAESSTAKPVTLNTPAESLSVACVTAQEGLGVPAEVQADSLTLVKTTGGSGPHLILANGQQILFTAMRSFEVTEVPGDPYRLTVTIHLLNGETVTDDVPVYNRVDARLDGIARYGLFSKLLSEVKKVEFQQGGCQ